MDNIIYSIIIPAYNEESVIENTYHRLKSVMDKLEDKYELIFVNDGSIDNTEPMLRGICNMDKNIKLISFTRNFGHQAAITAGMRASSGQAIVIIDADLQDPPEVIPEMIKKWKEGYDVVYGKRAKRKGETFLKKATASLFYRFLNSLTDIKIPADVGDFRLISRQVCDAYNSLKEKNPYVRGLISWIGYRQTSVEYIREERAAGKTKYSVKKMVKLASDGITSFSYKPLTLALPIGCLVTLLSIICIIYMLVCGITGHGQSLPFSTILLFLNLLLSGIILIVLGIIGQYIGRIFDETRNRPLYIVKSMDGFNENGKDFHNTIVL